MTHSKEESSSKKEKPLLIVDGYGFIFRAYHVQPPLSSPSGIAVGAIYGFTSMLMKLINDFKPDHAVIVLDHGGKNFRHDLYKEYKANRPPIADDLITQLKLVKKASRALNFITFSKEGFEADDLIATIASKANQSKRDTIIISGDKDFMQLTNEHIKMYDPTKSKYIDNEDINKKFGVTPDKVREVQALMGDKSDNIPGVAGFGPKTAAQLINQFGTVETLIASIDQISSKRQQELLRLHKEDALISWKLVGLDHNVPIEYNIEKDFSAFSWSPPSPDKISDFLNEYGFKSLHKRVENLFNLEITKSSNKKIISSTRSNLIINNKIINLKTNDEFNKLTQDIKISGYLSINLLQNENDVTKFILSAGGDLYCLNYEKQSLIPKDLFSYNNSDIAEINFNDRLHTLLEDSSIKKITYNLKNILRVCDCSPKSFDDLQLMQYVSNAGRKERNLTEIIRDYANIQIDDFKDSGTKEILPSLTDYFKICYDSLLIEIIENKALHLYQDIDLPLCYILHDMENAGIKIDINYLAKLSEEFGKKIASLEKEIFAIAGEEFNIASPKQLGEVLFEKMKLPFGKIGGKSKSYSTNASILEKLEEDGHAIAKLLLDYRHIAKLKNTYTDALPKLADPSNHRIHTTFLQTVTSTGRLSSNNPNVQNIPVRTSEGNNIRAAFITKPGHQLISADYSQIELRILSHVGNIKPLKQAFLEGRDIHAQTASQIFGIPLEQITTDIRRSAKAINFGIIYGISAFGLAKQLNISNKQAAEYIEKYFQEYPGIQQYMSETIEFAKTNEFVENAIGRKSYIPTINDKNHAMRSFGERAAINAPMQSLASDIIKLAMINLSKEFSTRSMKTKMLLQIHDELIFESPNDEVEIVSKLIKSTMESAFTISVDTKVEVNSGKNWQEIH